MPLDPLAAFEGVRSPYGHRTLPEVPPSLEAYRRALEVLAQMKKDISEKIARQAGDAAGEELGQCR